MAGYWIVLIAFAVYWTIGMVIAVVDEDWLIYWAVGLIYPIVYVICYPIRAWLAYNNSLTYYQKYNISRLQYLFGKRVHNRKYYKQMQDECKD